MKKEENFSLEPITDVSAISNAVTVYVERLAAKVTLNVSDELPKDVNGRYPIKVTVAGEDNPAGSGNIASEELYVELLGWKLNATAKKSYMIKNIDATWTDNDLGFTWNRWTDHRSHWGKSFNYGLSGYPAYIGFQQDTRNGRRKVASHDGVCVGVLGAIGRGSQCG